MSGAESKTARRVALVTGGRRGLGLSIAKALAASGFDLAVVDRAPLDARVENDVLQPLRAVGAKPLYLEADLADTRKHPGLIADVVRELGPLDCLVNNAGIASVVRGDFLDLTPENYDTIQNINLKATVFLTQAAVRAMLSHGSAYKCIINITSVSASLSSVERMDYCITKAGLSSFSQALALRLAGEGIGVFEVRPGIMRTDMTAAVAGKYDELIAGGLVPMRRWGEPGDIASICASLASGAFSFATGTVIQAGGALHIPRL